MALAAIVAVLISATTASLVGRRSPTLAWRALALLVSVAVGVTLGVVVGWIVDAQTGVSDAFGPAFVGALLGGGFGLLSGRGSLDRNSQPDSK